MLRRLLRLLDHAFRDAGGSTSTSSAGRCSLALIVLILVSGCGKTQKNLATEQLILSDAVDRSIRSIDFSPLSGYDCYLDAAYLNPAKSPTFVNADYLTSSIRNQMLAAGCRIVPERDKADLIVEPRVGTLGTDLHEVIYGIPSNSAIGQAASIAAMTQAGAAAAPMSSLPEISIARKEDQTAAAKIAVFAYHSKTQTPVWQSGVSIARSSASDRWIFGIGPFQSGSIYEKTRFAGTNVKLPLIGDRSADTRRQAVSLDEEFVFNDPRLLIAPKPEDVTQTAEADDETDKTDTK